MFSHIEVLWHILSIKTITIIFWLLCFILIWIDSVRKNNLNVVDFISQVTPIFIITIISGSWISYIITQWWSWFKMISYINLLLPHWFQLHFIWVVVWFLVWFYIFVLYKKSILERSKRVNLYANTVIKMIICLGLIFIIWDDVIWNITNSNIGIRSFQETSRVSALWKVIPAWIILSIIWTIVLICSKLRIRVVRWRWIMALFFIFCPVFLYRQHYPRYWVTTVLWFVLDIKIYFCIWLAIVFSTLAYINRSWK